MFRVFFACCLAMTCAASARVPLNAPAGEIADFPLARFPEPKKVQTVRVAGPSPVSVILQPPAGVIWPGEVWIARGGLSLVKTRKARTES